MDRDEERALVALNCRPQLGAVGILELVKQAGSAAAVLAGPRRWVFPWRRSVLLEEPAALLARAVEEQDELRRLGARLLTLADLTEYPERFLNLAHPPPVVAVLGDLSSLEGEEKRIAVVGARACTAYGKEQARRFGAGFAVEGAVVVSGAARGIDQEAMRGALECGGRVVAVIGSGLDRPYPPDAAPLLRNIIEAGGAVLSEFPCGTAPMRGNFPRRNRLIAALADGVVVVQASQKSGSMITAALANEIGREIFGVPGALDSVVSLGPLSLVLDGAHLAVSPLQVLDFFEPVAPMATEDPVLLALEEQDLALDELAVLLGRPEDSLLYEIVEHELRGRLTRLPGGLYHRCGPRPARHAVRTPPPDGNGSGLRP